jgi:flagellar biogenesis protein FliO
MLSSHWRPHAFALAGYVVVALAFVWPLPLHLETHLTGPPGGDTGVYVWNQWVFQHEILEDRHLPYFTERIFSLGRRANLSLHNYTTFQNLVALPLVGLLGVVATFNVVYLLMTVLTAYMAFLLARHVTGRVPESWLAGLAFAWSPALVTRGMGHFSVAAAAPLAAFMLVLLRTAERERMRDAVLLGVTVWWAASTDVYFAIYCLLIAVVFLCARTVTVDRAATTPRRAVPWALDVLMLSVLGLVIAMIISGGWQFNFLGRVARVRSLNTPMLVLTALALLRIGWRYRTHLAQVERTHVWQTLRLATVAGIFAAIMLSPVLYAVTLRIVQDGFDSQRTFWRSSPLGVDLVSFILPNPNHALTPGAVRAFLTPRPDAYPENVASLSFVLLAVVFVAWRLGWVAPRLWAGFAALFALLSLGPFIHILGVNTYVPGPWALLRYVPLLGLARTPARFTTVVMLMVAILFAIALSWLVARFPSRRRIVLTSVGALLIFELLPLPRELYSAEVPRVYRHVAAAPEDARVLELPFGVRDGTSSVGDFTARSQFFQTSHHKMLIGGYLSRVSRRRIAEIRRYEMLDALITLSEGRSLGPSRENRLIEEGPAFARRYRVDFVVIDQTRASPELRDFAMKAFRLHHVETDGPFELYRTP